MLCFLSQVCKVFQFSRFEEAFYASHHLEHDRVFRGDVGDADDFLKTGMLLKIIKCILIHFFGRP